MAYKKSDPFYHTARWGRARAAALNRAYGMCEDCMDRYRSGYGGKPRPATIVHHVIPIEERPDLALDINNLRCLCAACHNERHPEKGGGGRQDITRRAKMRVIKI